VPDVAGRPEGEERGVDGSEASEASPLTDLGDFIRTRREAARLSLRRLSDIAGVSNPYLSQIERGLRKPSAEILQAIAKGLEISSETLYVRAGILEDRTDEREVERAIHRDATLTSAQRDALIEMHRAFRELNARAGTTPGAAHPDTAPDDATDGMTDGAS
jgi:transcriptional regulator with XRE-family HTH domain